MPTAIFCYNVTLKVSYRFACHKIPILGWLVLTTETTIRLEEEGTTILSSEEGTISEEDGMTTRMSMNEEGTTRLVEGITGFLS
jgi:hypothetical protein